jgi:hypothetical protein
VDLAGLGVANIVTVYKEEGVGISLDKCELSGKIRMSI